jgi:hypothetical protein
MKRCCEVCANFRPSAELTAEQELVELRFGSRRVLLCKGHVRIAENSRVHSLSQLRSLYGRGRRSFVPRRGREAFAGEDERRRSPGRRAGDVRA